jgi:hypothetical protein
MKYRIMVVVALLAVFAAFGAAGKAKAAVAPSTFCINGHTFTGVTGGAATDYANAAAEGGFVVPTVELSEELAEIPSGFDDDEFLPSEGPFGFATTLISVSEGACAPAFAPPPVNIFLCYSVFQTEPGVWPKPQALALLAQGYWLAYAVPGNVPGGTNIGGFHLVCNLAAGQAVGDSFVGGDGTVLGPAYAGDAGLYPKIGP